MCGIAGFVQVEPGEVPAHRLTDMTGAIEHRGPDDSGYYRDPWANLGFRRLSIIDLAAGHQPMTNEAGNLWILYNGEIFNHAALRPDLERAGHRYHTVSDTETIIHAYEEYGPACVDRFRGMFAFALWDKDTRTLFCARDRLGIKPFYYFWDGRVFAFASEIKALLEHPSVSASFNESLLPEYLAFGYGSSEQTLFSGIRKLMPGHRLTLRLRTGEPELSISRYWDVPAPASEQRSESEWIGELRQRLEETVRLRLMSDVPLGVFLSGGVDSSLIAALMHGMVADPIKTFSVGYREAAFSELGYARQMAQSIGSDHHEVTVGMDDFFQALPQLIWHEDEPIAWPSSVALYFVSQLASKHVKVVLTGEGSDELFGGYGRYYYHHVNQRSGEFYGRLPSGLRKSIRTSIATSRLLSAPVRRKLGHTVLGRDRSLESLYLDNFYGPFSRSQRDRLMLHPGSADGPYEAYLGYWNRREGSSLLDRLLYADQKTYLVELLMKQDQMSMAASIESRVPFLDHPLVEFSTRIPSHLKLKGKVGKYIFKKACEGIVPNEIIYREKMGFPTPLKAWLLTPRAAPVYSFLKDPSGLLASYMDLPELSRVIDLHQQGVEDATDRIWGLLNLQIWGDIFLLKRQSRWADTWGLAPALQSL